MKNTTFANPFTPSLHESLYCKAQSCSEETFKKRCDECYDSLKNGRARLFPEFLFSNITRIEYANGKVRESISLLREHKDIYRHEIKRLSNLVRNGIAGWDNRVGGNIGKESHIDYYDGVCEDMKNQFDALYTPYYNAVLLTLKWGRDSELLANLKCAITLLDFAQKQMKAEVKNLYLIAPAVIVESQQYAIPYAKNALNLLSKVTDKLTDGVAFPEDENTRTAADNLFKVIGSPSAMNEFLVIDESNLPERPADMQEYEI